MVNVMLNVIMKSVFMQIVVRLRVVMLSVTAPIFNKKGNNIQQNETFQNRRF
jgi:hypothetical protein